LARALIFYASLHFFYNPLVLIDDLKIKYLDQKKKKKVNLMVSKLI